MDKGKQWPIVMSILMLLNYSIGFILVLFTGYIFLRIFLSGGIIFMGICGMSFLVSLWYGKTIYLTSEFSEEGRSLMLFLQYIVFILI